MRRTSSRLVNKIIHISLVITLIGVSVLGCGTKSYENACDAAGVTETATFPLVGEVVGKERITAGCYQLHVKRDDDGTVRSVNVSLFRYNNTQIAHRLTLSAQPK